MSTKQHWNLVSKYLAGECNEEEKKKVLDLMQSDSARKESIKTIQKVWNASDFLKIDKRPDSLDLNAELGKSLSRIRYFRTVKSESLKEHQSGKDSLYNPNYISQSEKRQYRSSSRIRSMSYFVKVAAIILMAFISGVLISYFLYVDNDSNQVVDIEPTFREVSTRASQIANVTLTDGSLINLSVQSKVLISEAYHNRSWDLFIEGLVHFDVVPDPNKSFIIRTPHALVRVLGTEFTVRAYPDDNYVQIIVSSGEVSMELASEDSGEQQFILTEGELGLINTETGQMSKKRVNAQKYLGWLEGKLVFDDITLAEVGRELQRWFDVEVMISDKSLEGNRITAIVDNRSLENVLDVLSIILDVTHEIDDDRKVVIIKQS